ncbi:MAG: PASTA domain-containing protein [Bacteroidia bacterium]|nr:PASTA domain-containing protein [Bacteroidia bacterium]
MGSVLVNLGVAAVVLVVLAILYFYAYLPSVTNHLESITVPNIEGMHMNELEDFLVKRNLRYEVNDSAYSSEFPPLVVLKQYPHPGAKVKENRKIFISVNRVTPPSVPVPDLIDGKSSLQNARAVLRSTDLKPGRIELRSSPFLNLVMELKYEGKTIEPGTRIPKGSVIDIVVGDGGKDSITMPSLLGLSLEDARFVLLGANLSVGHVELVGDTTDVSPVVLKQIPEMDEIVKVGDVVNLWVGAEGSDVPDDYE